MTGLQAAGLACRHRGQLWRAALLALLLLLGLLLAVLGIASILTSQSQRAGGDLARPGCPPGRGRSCASTRTRPRSTRSTRSC